MSATGRAEAAPGTELAGRLGGLTGCRGAVGGQWSVVSGQRVAGSG
jgi:hypothetical protein